jgi:NADPH-dependent 2,4-dienoyl-CoA reductase/sulfur reductase-like enzyme
MPYYIGDVIKDKQKLIARTPEEFRKTGIEVMLRTSVESIDSAKRTVRLSTGKDLPYDILVMATGADAVRPGIPGEDLEGVFPLRHLSDGLKVKDYLDGARCNKAVIIGGGFIAMEMAEAFRNLQMDVKVMDILPAPVARWSGELSNYILQELKKNEVEFLPETRPLSIEPGSECRLRVKTSRGDLDTDIVLVAIGIRYNIKLAESIGLKRGESGAIQVNFSQRTSIENVFAVGDCCEVFNRVSRRWTYAPLGDLANKQGRIAGQNIGGVPGIFPGIVGAQSFKLFGLEVAAAGLTEAEAIRSGFAPVSLFIWGQSVGRSLSKGEKIGLNMTADKSTGRLLGAQCVGVEGAVKRINTLSVALWNDMGLGEIGYLDLGYSPLFGGAWDPIHIAAQSLAVKL